MSSLNKSQLRTENNSSFPNNNSQFITPQLLRDFNADIIDSMVANQDSGSFLAGSTGSLLETASFDNGTRLMTFTKGDASTFDVSIPDALPSTASLLVTASVSDADITFTKGDASTFDILVNNVSSSISSSHAEVADEALDIVINAKNTSGATIAKGLAVHATGVTGQNVEIKLADASVSGDMPAIGVTAASIANNAVGKVVISGRLEGIDTSGLVAGASVFVNGAGVLTSTKPTGSDLIQNIGVCGKVNASEGEIIVLGSGRSNDIPNIQNGYGWFGNSDGVGEAQTTASFAKTDINNSFTGNQTFNDITVNGTGSFAYIQQVTGSAKVIGDAFLILNNDTPTERYAGIKVIDSGSTQDTASLQWDGSAHDWFYEFSSSAAHEYGVVLMGPEYNTLGTPTYNTNNTITKGTGGHHIVDSNITDDGSTITLGSTTNVSGPLSASNLDSIEITNLQNSGSEDRTRIDGLAAETGSYLNTGSTAQTKTAQITQQMDAPGTNSQKNFIQINSTETNGVSYGNVTFGIQNYPGFGRAYQDTFLYEMYNSFAYTYGTEQALNGGEWHALTVTTGSGNYGLIRVRDDYAGNSDIDVQGTDIRIGTFGGVYANSTLQIGRNSQTNTQFLGSQTFSGGASDESFFNHTTKFGTNIILSGSVITDLETVSISSETASIDFNTAQTKVLTLVSGSDTHVTFTSQNIGQTVILKIKQPGTGYGTLTFEPGTTKQPNSLHYSASQVASAEDVLTLQTIENDGFVYVVSAKQFN